MVRAGRGEVPPESDVTPPAGNGSRGKEVKESKSPLARFLEGLRRVFNF